MKLYLVMFWDYANTDVVLVTEDEESALKEIKDDSYTRALEVWENNERILEIWNDGREWQVDGRLELYSNKNKEEFFRIKKRLDVLRHED